MTVQTKLDVALLVSKTLRRRLLQASGILVLLALVFVGLLFVVAEPVVKSGPGWLLYFLVGVPILSILGAVCAFVYWLVTVIQAAILGTAVDDVIEEAERRGLIDRDE